MALTGHASREIEVGAGVKAGCLGGLLAIFLIPLAVLLANITQFFVIIIYILLIFGVGVIAGRFARPPRTTSTYISSGIVGGIIAGLFWTVLMVGMLYGLFSLMPADMIAEANQIAEQSITPEQQDQLRQLNIDPQHLLSGAGLNVILGTMGAICGFSSLTLGAVLGALGGVAGAATGPKGMPYPAGAYPPVYQQTQGNIPPNYQYGPPQSYTPPPQYGSQPPPGYVSPPPYQYTPPQQPNPYIQPGQYGQPGLYSQPPASPQPGPGDQTKPATEERPPSNEEPNRQG